MRRSQDRKRMNDLTFTEKVQECKKVFGNFLYFLNTYVWIEDKERKCPIKLTLWPSQAAIIPEILNNLLLILLKTRQVGLTWLAAAYVLWLGIRSPLFLAIIISASEDHAIEFLNRVYFVFDRLPYWLFPPIKTRTKLSLEFEHANNTVATIKSMPTIEMGAESKTPNLLIIDEAHTIREIKSIYSSSYPGIEQAKGQVIIISNSVKTGPGWGFVRDLYLDSKSGENSFKRVFLPWTAHPDRPADFRERMGRAGMAKEDVIQHYPETEDEAVSALGSSYFGDALSRHIHTRRGVVGNFRTLSGTKQVYFEPQANGIVEMWKNPYIIAPGWDGQYWQRRYCLGSDVSEGVGQSYSVAYIMDRDQDEFVCKIKSNRIDAHLWAEALAMASEYYDRALITVERTGAGQTTVKRLEEMRANQSVKIVPGKVDGGLSGDFGWNETRQSKHELCGDLRRWLKEMRGTIWDAELLGQCQTWIQDEMGRLGPEEGKLGDCVIGAGCTIQSHQFLGAPEKIPKLVGIRRPPKDGTEAADLERRQIFEDLEHQQTGGEMPW